MKHKRRFITQIDRFIEIFESRPLVFVGRREPFEIIFLGANEQFSVERIDLQLRVRIGEYVLFAMRTAPPAVIQLERSVYILIAISAFFTVISF